METSLNEHQQQLSPSLDWTQVSKQAQFNLRCANISMQLPLTPPPLCSLDASVMSSEMLYFLHGAYFILLKFNRKRRKNVVNVLSLKGVTEPLDVVQEEARLNPPCC